MEKRILGLVLLFILSIVHLDIKAQTQSKKDLNSIENQLVSQGVWFLFSARTDESYSDETLTKVDFFLKGDVSSILFDQKNKLYSVFSKDGETVLEDRWKMVDENHFVIVSPADKSSQLMDILELTPTKLVIRNCSEIEGGSKCITYTYFPTKKGWLSDEEITDLNGAGIIESDKLAEK